MTKEELQTELATVTKQLGATQEELEVQQAGNAELIKENAQLNQENLDLKAKVEELDAKLAESNSLLEKSKAEIANAAEKEAKVDEPIKVPVNWKTPLGELVSKIVTVTSLKVRLKDRSIVSGQSLMKVATGKPLTEAELKVDPTLEGLTKEEALALITHWAKINAGIIKAL